MFVEILLICRLLSFAIHGVIWLFLVGVGDMLRAYPNQGEVMLQAVLITSLSQELVGKLFDLIPGMEYCHYDPTSGMFV